MLLFLPIYATQACRQLGSVRFVVCYTLATLSVSRTSFLRARAIDVIVWTGHGVILFYVDYNHKRLYRYYLKLL